MSDARFTPQLGIAAGIVLVALAVCWTPLFTGPGDHPIPVADLKVRSAAVSRQITPASVATAPLVRGYAAQPESNPWTLKPQGSGVKVRIPLPPPPPLATPAPPVLPLPEN